MTDGLEDKYLEFAELLSELSSHELKIRNMKRLVEELRNDLSQVGNDGSYGMDFSGHAFKQISERLEILAMENPAIYKDVFKESRSDWLLLPSNLQTFIITLLANARKKGNFKEEKSKNSNGTEFRYTIDIKGGVMKKYYN
jgi:hypothetical protein